MKRASVSNTWVFAKTLQTRLPGAFGERVDRSESRVEKRGRGTQCSVQSTQCGSGDAHWGLDQLDATGFPTRANQGEPATSPRHPTACDVWIYSELETGQASLERH
jgi:hypothetical protein